MKIAFYTRRWYREWIRPEIKPSGFDTWTGKKKRHWERTNTCIIKKSSAWYAVPVGSYTWRRDQELKGTKYRKKPEHKKKEKKDIAWAKSKKDWRHGSRQASKRSTSKVWRKIMHGARRTWERTCLSQNEEVLGTTYRYEFRRFHIGKDRYFRW